MDHKTENQLSYGWMKGFSTVQLENLFGPYFHPHQSHNYGYAPSSGENLTSKI